MKKAIFISLFLFGVLSAQAQSPIDKGDVQFNAGVGLSSWGFPVYLGLDFGVHPDISIGLQASFRTYREKLNNTRYNHGVLGVGFIADYHFNRLLDLPSPWDFYAGLNAGYFYWNSPAAYPGGRTSGLLIGGQIGGRYYFNNKVGINLQFGGGNAFSGGRLGVSVKI